jgi:hypothetical protein
MNDARLHIGPDGDPHVEVAVASTITPFGMIAAGTHGVGVLSIGAGPRGGPEALASKWKIDEDATAKKWQDGQPVVLVEDNGPIHVSKLAQAVLAARGHWLTIEWLPKYTTSRLSGVISRRIILPIKPSQTSPHPTKASMQQSKTSIVSAWSFWPSLHSLLKTEAKVERHYPAFSRQPWRSSRSITAMALLGAAALLYPGTAKAFDCNKSFLPVDFVICSNPAVFNFNEAHEKAWIETRAVLTDAQKAGLLNDQRRWLKEYPPQCGVPARGKAPQVITPAMQTCVGNALEQRTAFCVVILVVRRPVGWRRTGSVRRL